MTKLIGFDVSVVQEIVSERYGKTTTTKILLRSLAYEDGRIIEQCGIIEDWVQIKDPDIFFLGVGKCKDCGKTIFESEDWDYHEGKDENDESWVRHQTEEDCKK